MISKTMCKRGRVLVLAALLFLVSASGGWAAIPGLTGTTFNFTAKPGHITIPEGSSTMIWGFADDATGQVQYPGPTLIVTQGQTITINLKNTLPEPVSIVIPGQQVTATGGLAGPLTQEVPADNGVTTVSYSFTPTEPGTYTYYSGSHPDLQVEMGLLGALIVRPAAQNLAACSQYDSSAYGDCRSAYDYEFLFLLTEMDPEIHTMVEMQMAASMVPAVDTSTFWPTAWFINGRGGPDTMAPANAAWLPTQPYNCFPLAHVGGRLLLRMIGGGRDSHPYHTHGNNFDLIARDGVLLESIPGAFIPTEVGVVPDLSISDYTQHVSPGGTFDAIFAWTGRGLNWDIFGHAPGDAMATNEYAPDHGKPFPVILPDNKDMTFGGFWSGSPFLGTSGALPPGEGGLNPYNGLSFMWHSHNEKELTNIDIFPGGMMTMFIVVPSDVVIE